MTDSTAAIAPILTFDDEHVHLGGGIDIDDDGMTILITRAADGHRLMLSARSRVRFADGRSWWLVPIVRQLASRPRGERLPLAQFPIIGEDVEALLFGR